MSDALWRLDLARWAEPVLCLSAEGRLLWSNHAARRLLGHRLEADDGGLRIADSTLADAVARARERASPDEAGVERVTLGGGDGEGLWEVRAALVHAEGRSFVACMVQALPGRRRFEAFGNDLVSTVAHELRTPLTSLRMALHLCLADAAGPLTRKQHELLSAARDDCERLQRTSDDLLDLSRIESGWSDLRPERVEPLALLATVREAHQAAAESRAMAVETVVLPDCPAVHADRERLELVVSNLLSNALRHTPSGGRVRLSAVADGNAVRFEVTDNGEGIPPEFRARVFDKFFRVPGRRGQGSGLGLAIAREIVRAHGGTIGVEEAEGGGCRFWFRLPGA